MDHDDHVPPGTGRVEWEPGARLRPDGYFGPTQRDRGFDYRRAPGIQPTGEFPGAATAFKSADSPGSTCAAVVGILEHGGPLPDPA